MTKNREVDGGSRFDGVNTEREGLTFRQYIGLLAPNACSVRELRERAKDLRPLTLREYFGIMPFPNIDDLIDLGKWTGKGIQRLWNRVAVRRVEQPPLEPENCSSIRNIKALAAGLAVGITTFTVTKGVSSPDSAAFGLAVMASTMTAAYLFTQRK